MDNQRNRILRKKLYLDRFAIFGFKFTCGAGILESEFDALLENFTKFIESRNLVFSGGGDTKTFGGFVCSNDRYGSTSKIDQTALEEWLKLNDAIYIVEVGPLVDANYGI